jgi:hypothetical protein
MKKLIAALFAAVLMAAGLVVATTSTAAADCAPTQYSGCVRTITKVSSPAVIPLGSKAKLCATVRAKNSNATPVGTVVFKIKRNVPGAGDFHKKRKNLRNGVACVKTKKLRRVGGYNVVAKYKSPRGSIFINSFGSAGWDVRR